MNMSLLTLGSLALGGGRSNITISPLRQSHTAMRASRGKHHAQSTSMFPVNNKMMENVNYYYIYK